MANSSRHWLVKSMTGGTRVVAALLSVLTTAMCLVLVLATYRISTSNIASAPVAPLTSAQASSVPTDEDGSSANSGTNESLTPTNGETIEEDSVPMAAAPGQRANAGLPTFMVLGTGVGCVITFFVLRIRRIDAHISDMSRSLR